MKRGQFLHFVDDALPPPFTIATERPKLLVFKTSSGDETAMYSEDDDVTMFSDDVTTFSRDETGDCHMVSV